MLSRLFLAAALNAALVSRIVASEPPAERSTRPSVQADASRPRVVQTHPDPAIATIDFAADFVEPQTFADVPAEGDSPFYGSAPAPEFDSHGFQDAATGALACPECEWGWQLLPDGLIYKSYMAGVKEPRMSGALLFDLDDGWRIDSVLGGRLSLVRLGTTNLVWPEGWELQVEGGAFLRQNLAVNWDVDAVDFRIGVPLVYRRDRFQWKFGFYHISSHLGDEFLLRNPGFPRINYLRDSLILGFGYYPTYDLRLYTEFGYAFHTDGGAEPLELQFGADYSPVADTGFRGSPFAAVNVHLREEVDFGGGLNLMAGWQWRSAVSGRTLRLGLQFYTGKSRQYALFRQSEELIGLGVWYDY